MTTFGKRGTWTPAATAQAPRSAAAPPPLPGRYAASAIFAAIAALTAAHFWISILRVPWLRPMGPLFGAGPASYQGWAPWYAAPLFAAALTLLVLHLYFRRPHRWTLVGLAGAGLVAVVFGGWAAYWVKNIGYTWYFVPGASVAAILGVQPQMAAVALGNAIRAFMHAPLLLLIGLTAGAVTGLVLRRPLRAAADATPAAATNAAPDQTPTERRAGWPARIITTVLMALLGGAVGYGVPAVGVLVMPICGLIWFFVSFRHGRYVFRNVLIGGSAIGFLSALPLAVALMQIDPSALVIGTAVRVPVFVLISVAVIKTALLLSRATAKAPGSPTNALHEGRAG